MSKKLDWRRAAPRKPSEDAFPDLAKKRDENQVKGGWSHIKREPVKSYTPAEIAAFMRARRAD